MLNASYTSVRKTQNLGKSTYKRNSSAYSVLENDIASGKSKFFSMLIDVYIDLVGSSRTQAEMIKSLAGIIKDEDCFEKSFRESVAIDTGKKNINNNKQSTNRVNDLIEASRVFTIEK